MKTESSSMKTLIRGLSLSFAIAAAVQMPMVLAEAPDAYAVSQRFNLTGAGKWDFISLDARRDRLFVTRNDHVDVVSSKTGELIGTIADTPGVHGVAFAQGLKIGFTSNGKSNSVTVFDLDTLKTLRTIKVSGANPDALLYDEPSQRLYTFNGKTANITVINAKKLEVVQTIEVSGKPELPASDGQTLFVNLEDKAAIAVIDMKTGKMKTSWALIGCTNPTGLALDVKRARLFSTCDNQKMVVTNAKTGEQVAIVPIGLGPDGVAYDGELQTIFSSNGKDGTLTVVQQNDADHYSVLTTLQTEKGAKTLAYDAASRRIFMPTVVEDRFMVLVVSPR